MAQSRIHTLQATVKNLYMDRQHGKISETLFYSILEDHEKELKEIERRLPELEKKAEAEIRYDKNTEKWIGLVSKYIGVTKIDREMALEMIDEIRVSAQYKVNGKRTQDVEITYKLVGDLSSLMANPPRQYNGKWLETAQ